MKILRAISNLLKYLNKEKNRILSNDSEIKNTDIIESSEENNSFNHTREWAIQKIQSLNKNNQNKNALAIASEFDEWIDVNTEEIECIFLEDPGWTDEQELDVIEPSS